MTSSPRIIYSEIGLNLIAFFVGMLFILPFGLATRFGWLFTLLIGAVALLSIKYLRDWAGKSSSNISKQFVAHYGPLWSGVAITLMIAVLFCFGKQPGIPK